MPSCEQQAALEIWDYHYSKLRCGEGAAVPPGFITSPGYWSGDAIELLLDSQPPPVRLTLIFPPYEKLPPLVGLFTEYFEGVVPKAMSFYAYSAA